MRRPLCALFMLTSVAIVLVTIGLAQTTLAAHGSAFAADNASPTSTPIIFRTATPTTAGVPTTPTSTPTSTPCGGACPTPTSISFRTPTPTTARVPITPTSTPTSTPCGGACPTPTATLATACAGDAFPGGVCPTWTLVAQIPVSFAVIGRNVVAGNDGRIYAIAGLADYGAVLDSAYAYSPATDQWSEIPRIPLSHVGAAVASGADRRLYTFGGGPWGNRNETFIYDEDTGTWTAGMSQPDARFSAGAALARDGKIYVVGGTTNDHFLNSVLAYDPLSATWSAAPSVTYARAGLSVVADAQGRVYAIGGGDQSAAFNMVERYDPRTNAWSSLARLAVPRIDAAAVLGPDGRIYVFGGLGNQQIHGSVEIYDPVADTWSFGPTLPRPDYGGGAAVGSDGRIYYVEGGGTAVWALSLPAATPMNTPTTATVTATQTPTATTAATQSPTNTPTATLTATRTPTDVATGTLAATRTPTSASPASTAATSRSAIVTPTRTSISPAVPNGAANSGSPTSLVAGARAVPRIGTVSLPNTGTGATRFPIPPTVLALAAATTGLLMILVGRRRALTR